MHNRTTTPRVGFFLALLAAAAGASLAGCSSDDNPDITGTGLDAAAGLDVGAGVDAPSGADATVSAEAGVAADAGVDSASDGSVADSSGDGAADAGNPPLFALVHAAPDVPGVRFCFGVSPAGALAGVIAKPATAGGLPFGAGGALTVAASQAAVLAGTNLYIWAIPASSINSASDAGPQSTDCAAASSLPGAMLFSMIPAGTFQYNHSYIVAMVGCQDPDVDGGQALCGSAATDGGTVAFPSGPPLGNLRLEIVAVDNTTPVPQDAIGAQFLHLSPSLQALIPGGVIPGITSPGDASAAPDEGDASPAPDASDAAPEAVVFDYADLTTTPVTYNGVYSGPPGSTVAAPSQAFTGTTAAAADLATAGIGLRTAGLVVPAPALASISLATVAAATLGPGADGGLPTASDLFTTGQSYTFIAVGNVGQAPGTSATFFRIIALPSVH
jgi:hypothetical protein